MANEVKLYAVGQRDIVKQGQHYFNHVLHMTREGLHEKSDIAAELAHRDIEIAAQAARIDELRRDRQAAWDDSLQIRQELAAAQERLREADWLIDRAMNRDDHYTARKHDWQAKMRALPDSGAVKKDAGSFQCRVAGWMHATFSQEVCTNIAERNHRFLEEALELVQAKGCTREEAHMLVDYTFGRPVGDPPQEVGGVLVTLAALCGAADMDMAACGETELARCWQNIEKIRAKQATKPKSSPLPGTTPVAQAAEPVCECGPSAESYELLSGMCSFCHRGIVVKGEGK